MSDPSELQLAGDDPLRMAARVCDATQAILRRVPRRHQRFVDTIVLDYVAGRLVTGERLLDRYDDRLRRTLECLAYRPRARKHRR